MGSEAVERAEAGASQPEAAEVLDPIAELGDMALAEDAEAQPTDGDEHDEQTEEQADEEQADETEEGEESESEEEAEEADAEADAGAKKDRWQKRVDTLTFKLKSEQEAAAKAKAEAEAAAERASAAEERSAAGIALPPDYLTGEQLALVREGNSLMERREFLLRHIGSGYDDAKDDARSMSAAEVADELVRLERNAWKIQEAQSVYRKAHAEMLEDMRVGRELKAARAKAKPKKAAPKPTVAAAAPAGGARKPVAAVASRGGVNLKRFEERGGDADAAAAELAELTGAID
jgi:hypothetical protein